MSRSFTAIAFAAALLAPTAGAYAQDSQKLFFEGDMVRGVVPQAGLTGPSCVLTSQFKRKESVVWRVRVLDATGKTADSSVLKSLAVEMADGQKFPMRFGPHPRGRTDDYFWSAAWVIPADYPTGTLTYKVTAVDQAGRTHTWEPFKIQPSQLTVVPGEVEFTRP